MSAQNDLRSGLDQNIAIYGQQVDFYNREKKNQETGTSVKVLASLDLVQCTLKMILSCMTQGEDNCTNAASH